MARYVGLPAPRWRSGECEFIDALFRCGAVQHARDRLSERSAVTSRVMPDEQIPPPEPKEIDSQKWLEWKDLMDRAILRAYPLEEFGRVYRCDNCLFYLDPDADLSYCWHPNLRILVGGSWWCQWWEEIPAAE